MLSNVWFSLFCFGLGFLFLAMFLRINTNIGWPVQFLDNYTGTIVGLIGAAISALVNDLFGKGRIRYRIAQASVLLSLLLLFFRSLENYVLAAVVLVVLAESIILVIRAIINRVPGARIIGAGILFSALTMILLTVLVMMGASFAVTITNAIGALIILCVILAIVAIPFSMSAYLAWSFARVNKKLGLQLKEVERLSAEALHHQEEKQRLMQVRQDELEEMVSARTEELRGQKEKSDDLLRNILPAEVAEELKAKGSAAARLYQNVTVLFTDFEDFTQMAERLSPDDLVAELDQCFSAFDGIITRHGLEKIKTVGDAYIAVSGMPQENPAHARDVLRAALEIRDFMLERKAARPDGSFSVRLGVHSGPVVAGIVGVKKFAYDIWGDTVNTAARMEQHSEPGKINISATTYALVQEQFRCSYRGELEAKHKGRMGMYFVEG